MSEKKLTREELLELQNFDLLIRNKQLELKGIELQKQNFTQGLMSKYEIPLDSTANIQIDGSIKIKEPEKVEEE